MEVEAVDNGTSVHAYKEEGGACQALPVITGAETMGEAE